MSEQTKGTDEGEKEDEAASHRQRSLLLFSMFHVELRTRTCTYLRIHTTAVHICVGIRSRFSNWLVFGLSMVARSLARSLSLSRSNIFFSSSSIYVQYSAFNAKIAATRSHAFVLKLLPPTPRFSSSSRSLFFWLRQASFQMY